MEHGRLLSTRSEAALLSAYVIQGDPVTQLGLALIKVACVSATLGPYNEQEFPDGYSREMKLAAAYKDSQFYNLVEEYHRDKMP